MTTPIIGARVRLIRQALRMKQAELSESSGISVTYISELENGKRDNLTVKVLIALATTLQCSPCWLLSGGTQPPILLAFGPYIEHLRKDLGYTLRDVEERTGRGVSNAYLSQLEHGKIKAPNPNVLHLLAQVYEVSYMDLMYKAGYPVTEP